ncbi:hypothetical protein BU26DRAFT_15753 [Trematosphaeria pertusa]|uniref:J domain-containing protein n=1 Tax=Trematosphaeria pertusa TaxID=390896 RepID=A0A6A6J1U2_9PLEO|nr:uncharacterized protein BU26DRAFT_15753 [Trematosphaeria pertusa]KAF2256162.1 hypothetical protein BU26DRAFT_15753 [Trematosphaeria pertusa]
MARSRYLYNATQLFLLALYSNSSYKGGTFPSSIGADHLGPPTHIEAFNTTHSRTTKYTPKGTIRISPTMLTPYEILGVKQYATLSEIKAAYVEMAIRNHPDKTVGLTEEERRRRMEVCQAANNAWELLRDPAFRPKYDSYEFDPIEEGWPQGPCGFTFKSQDPYSKESKKAEKNRAKQRKQAQADRAHKVEKKWEPYGPADGWTYRHEGRDWRFQINISSNFRVAPGHIPHVSFSKKAQIAVIVIELQKGEKKPDQEDVFLKLDRIPGECHRFESVYTETDKGIELTVTIRTNRPEGLSRFVATKWKMAFDVHMPERVPQDQNGCATSLKFFDEKSPPSKKVAKRRYGGEFPKGSAEYPLLEREGLEGVEFVHLAEFEYNSNLWCNDVTWTQIAAFGYIPKCSTSEK